MAKVMPRSAAPQAGYSPGYTWMLLFTFLAGVGACALLYLELDGDYGFQSEPKGLAPVPKVAPLAPRDAPRPKDNTTRLPQEPGDDRANAPVAPDPILADQRPRGVGPVIFQMPPSPPGFPSR